MLHGFLLYSIQRIYNFEIVYISVKFTSVADVFSLPLDTVTPSESTSFCVLLLEDEEPLVEVVVAVFVAAAAVLMAIVGEADTNSPAIVKRLPPVSSRIPVERLWC